MPVRKEDFKPYRIEASFILKQEPVVYEMINTISGEGKGPCLTHPIRS